jgi:hypothetical protein
VLPSGQGDAPDREGACLLHFETDALQDDEPQYWTTRYSSILGTVLWNVPCTNGDHNGVHLAQDHNGDVLSSS